MVSRYHGVVGPVPTQLHEDEDLEYICPTVEPIIVGIASTIAAGRTTAINHLVTRYGFRVFSLAQMLKELAIPRGIPLLRGRLQEFGSCLRETRGDEYLAVRLRMSREWLASPSAIVVVDSIKHQAEVDEFRRKQKSFRLLGIDAPPELRWRRMQQRHRSGDPESYEDFLRQDAINNGSDDAPHGQQVRQLLRNADKLISNSGTIEEFLQNIDEAVGNWLYA